MAVHAARLGRALTRGLEKRLGGHWEQVCAIVVCAMAGAVGVLSRWGPGVLWGALTRQHCSGATRQHCSSVRVLSRWGPRGALGCSDAGAGGRAFGPQSGKLLYVINDAHVGGVCSRRLTKKEGRAGT